MEYRGIRYTIRSRIERDQWVVAIHPEDVESAGKVINGNRAEAELLARSMINKWFERHRPTAAGRQLTSQSATTVDQPG
jgi:hypothetical protein